MPKHPPPWPCTLACAVLLETDCGARADLGVPNGYAPAEFTDAGSTDAATDSVRAPLSTPGPDASAATAGAAADLDARSADQASTSPNDASFDVDAAILAICLTGGDVLFVDGDPGNITHVGPLLFGPNSGSFYATAATPDSVEVSLWPNNMTYGDGWTVYLATAVRGESLAIQRYDNVQMFFGATAGRPSMYIQGGWYACGTISGWFQIEQLDETVVDAGGGVSIRVHAITATFEQYCDGSTAALRGCVHVEQP